MAALSVKDARCEALFVSALQPSDSLAPETVADAISNTVREFGARGCVCRMAQEFGDHPEEARDRMQWVRELLRELPAPSPRPSARSAGLAA
jgi:hypothetical protein